MQLLSLSSRLPPGYATASNLADLCHYFEYSSHGIEVVADGLKEISFGEYLVDQQVVDRFELFRALQMQDRLPGMRLGECVAALGYATMGKIETLYTAFNQLLTVTVD